MSKVSDSQAEPEKVDLKSLDVAEEKRRELLRLFPEVRTEGEKIDFDRLKLTLGEMVDVGKERYGLTWPGKADCFRTIQTPSMATLRPMREESVNFDTTENLIIEGDNLEVLKLLQKAYLGKVKMIYIDPPYNTGNDFIYPDNYAESLQTYLEYTGQVDMQGKKFSTNTEADGRFHSKWLNMMYPRLSLARNLLRPDGVIFISCDDHEVENLRRVCDEVFGEEHFLGQITVINNMKGRNDEKYFATAHEYLVVYGKSGFAIGGLPLTDDQKSEYQYVDDNGRKYGLRDLRKRGAGDRRADRPNMFFPLYFDPSSRRLYLERQSDANIEILPIRGDGTDGRWRWGRERVAANLNLLEARKSERSGRWGVEYRVHLENLSGDDVDNEDLVERTGKAKSAWIGPEFSTDVGRRAFKALLPELDYDYPKPVGLLARCLHLGLAATDGLVLDFFAGSGTTGDAVLQLNADDGGHRRFILIQLPEPLREAKNGFSTIADITKERARRVAAKLNADDASKLTNISDDTIDRGFRVFDLNKSNLLTWDADTSAEPKDIATQLDLHVHHLRPGRTDDDLLFEILLKEGFAPTVRIEMVTMSGLPVCRVLDGAMLICLSRELTLDAIRAMAASDTQRVVCLDAGFAGNDQLKTNAVQIFKSKGIVFRTV